MGEPEGRQAAVPDGAAGRVSVVIATRDRRSELLGTLEWLTALPDRPQVIVVDHASRDGAADAVAARFPAVRLVRLPRNLGATARNVGVALASTPYVAFSDDGTAAPSSPRLGIGLPSDRSPPPWPAVPRPEPNLPGHPNGGA